MTEKIMKVFYDTNGLPYKDKARQVHYPLVGSAFMGASNTTQIRFYVSLLGNSNDTWVSCAKLPNGQLGYKMLSATYDSEEGEYYVSLSLTTFYTQYKGDVYIALQGYQSGVSIQETSVGSGIYKIVGTPTIQATGVIKLAMNYTPQISPSALSENITPEDIQEFLSAISTAIGGVIPKISTSNITNYDFDINLFHENEIVFNDNDNVFYKLINNNGVLKAQQVVILTLDSNNKGIISANTLDVSTIRPINDSVVIETPNHEISINDYEGSAKMVSKWQLDGETVESGLYIADDNSVELLYGDSNSILIVDDIELMSARDIYIGADRNVVVEGGSISFTGTKVAKNNNEIINGYTCVGIINTNGGETNSTDKQFINKLPTFLFSDVRVDIAPYYNISKIMFRQEEIGSRVYYSEIFKYVGTPAGGKYMRLKIEFASDFNSYSATITNNEELTNKSYVDDKLVGVYKIHGSASVDELNSMEKTSSLNGSIYNVHTDGVLVNYDGSTVAVRRGDNVLFVWHDGNWSWDDLAGFIDTSNFVLKSTTIAGNDLSANISGATLTDSLVFATNSEIDALFE